MANDAIALTADNPLYALTQQAADVKPKESLPYLGFYSKRAEKAIDIASSIKGIGEGEPYLHLNGAYTAVTSIGLVGPTFHYWAELDNEFKVTSATLSNPGRGSSLREHLLAPTIVYTKQGAFAALTTFRPTKVKAALDLINGIAGASDEACAAAGPIGKELTKLPKTLRIVGDVDVIHKTSQSGFKYQLARCRTRLLSDVEIQSLINVLSEPTFNETIARVTESYEARKATIEAAVPSNG